MKTCLLVLPLFALAALPVHAADESLPGVRNDHRIVQPALEPEPEETTSGSPTHFWVGKTEVKITGSITVDVTAGDDRIRPNPDR